MKQPAILYVASGFILGVGLASWIAPEMSAFMSVVGALLCLWWIRLKALLLAGSAVAGILVTAASPLTPSAQDISHLAGQRVTGTALVTGYPEHTGGRQRVILALSVGDRRGRVLTYLDPYPVVQPGQRVRFDGKLEVPEPLPDFDYRTYLAKDGIHTISYRPRLEIEGTEPTLERMMFPVRQMLLGSLGRLFHEPAAGFLAAILIGERTGLPDSLEEDFRRTGTVHVMALSGYNISILVAAVVAVLGRRRSVVWIAFIIIIGFVVLVGPSPPVVRAALMGCFLLLAQVFGRPQLALHACIIAGAGMVASNPWALRYDLGFQLSFLATLGILLLEEPIRLRLTAIPEPVRGITSATIAATLPTAPLIAFTFGTFSTISPLANVIVVPIIPLLMAGAFFCAVGGIILAPLGQLMAVPFQLVTDFVLNIVHVLATVPGASISVSWMVLALGSAVVIGWTWKVRGPSHA